MLLLLPLFFSLASCDLRFVAVVWRHGDRAPSELPYPNDKHNESAWPRGWNQLTNEGITQTYELGQWLKLRYIDSAQPLLKKNFDRKEVFLRSTDSERAIQSAQAVAAGLYPPTGNMVWNLGTLKGWQPVPIHTNGDGRDDTLLKPTSVDCPAYTRLMTSANDDQRVRVNRDYAELFRRLANYSGFNAIDYDNIKELYDITREMAHDLEQPAWVNEEWNGTKIVDHIRELKRITRTAEFNSVEKAKYRGGVLVNDWLEKLEGVKSGDYKKKAVFYSSHDGTLSALTYSMGVNDGRIVPYAGAVIAELHQTGSNYSVQLFFKNSTDTLVSLTLQGCVSDCPLEKFSQLLADVRIRSEEQREQMCRSTALLLIFLPILVPARLFW